MWDEARGAYTRDDRRDGYQEDRGGLSRRLVEKSVEMEQAQVVTIRSDKESFNCWAEYF